jgi:hypothetical protein
MQIAAAVVGSAAAAQVVRPRMRHVAIDFGNGEGADYWAEEITIEAAGRWLNLAHGYAEDGTAFNTASVPLLGGTWQVDGAPGPAAADRLASGETL